MSTALILAKKQAFCVCLLNWAVERISIIRTNLVLFPGVGPITAVSFIAEVAAIKRFNHSKQLVAYIGLDSRVHQSGTSVRGNCYIFSHKLSA